MSRIKDHVHLRRRERLTLPPIKRVKRFLISQKENIRSKIIGAIKIFLQEIKRQNFKVKFPFRVRAFLFYYSESDDP